MFPGPRRTLSVRIIALFLSALFVFAAIGCGRKGPLYLPDDLKQPPNQAPAPAK